MIFQEPALTGRLFFVPADTRTRGLKTWEELAVLGGDPGQTVARTFYYDSRGRLIQTVEQNHLGGISRYSTAYDFVGNVLAANESHQAYGATHSVATVNEYDHRGRLVSTATALDGGTPATVGYAYNELGQLSAKTLGALSPIAYSYNLQGWQTGQSSERFATSLSYFDGRSYTGNITFWEFGSGAAMESFYELSYDRFGRITRGTSSPWSNDENITRYDRNGNILRFTRGLTAVDLRYDGNQLVQYYNRAGYTYDANGNMTREPRWALNLKYNFLNLLEQADRGGTINTSYRWLADGTKAFMSRIGGLSYDYLGSLTVNNDFWSQSHAPEVYFGEGVIRPNGVTYFEKDHVGSVRATVTENGTPKGTVVGRYDYTPFGKRLTRASYPQDANNRFYFNGKEIQTIDDWTTPLDYGARIYDPEILRWEKPDPLAEKYPEISPYVFSNNNPVLYVDKDGRDPIKALQMLYESLSGRVTLGFRGAASIDLANRSLGFDVNLGSGTIAYKDNGEGISMGEGNVVNGGVEVGIGVLSIGVEQEVRDNNNGTATRTTELTGSAAIISGSHIEEETLNRNTGQVLNRTDSYEANAELSVKVAAFLGIEINMNVEKATEAFQEMFKPINHTE